MKLDLGHPGPLGMDVKISGKVVFIGGSNHVLEWLHNALPFAGMRERMWARQVLTALEERGIEWEVIAGHSIGGTVASNAAKMRRRQLKSVRLYTYGAKRVQRRWETPGKHVRVKGDWVPFLPPWRPKFEPTMVLDYGKLTPAEAHAPRMYYEQMQEDGVR